MEFSSKYVSQFGNFIIHAFIQGKLFAIAILIATFSIIYTFAVFYLMNKSYQDGFFKRRILRKFLEKYLLTTYEQRQVRAMLRMKPDRRPVKHRPKPKPSWWSSLTLMIKNSFFFYWKIYAIPRMYRCLYLSLFSIRNLYGFINIFTHDGMKPWWVLIFFKWMNNRIVFIHFSETLSVLNVSFFHSKIKKIRFIVFFSGI